MASAAVIAIDAFDHGPAYDGPAALMPNFQVPRQALFENHTGVVRKRQDKRVFNKNAYRTWTSPSVEKYQFLLLHTQPLMPPPPPDNPAAPDLSYRGFLERSRLAEARYSRWRLEVAGAPALEVLHFERIAPFANRISRMTNEVFCRRRLIFQATPTAVFPGSRLRRINTNRDRHIYLPASSSSLADPHYVPSIFPAPARASEAIARQYIGTAGAGVPRYAIGCTCRDWIFNAQFRDAAGNLHDGKAKYGCKHMLFYNFCRRKNDPNGIVYPAGVVPM